MKLDDQDYLLPFAEENAPLYGSEATDTVQQLEDTGAFFQVLKIAESYGLEAEFIVYYSRGLRDGMTILEAVNYARDEWDI